MSFQVVPGEAAAPAEVSPPVAGAGAGELAQETVARETRQSAYTELRRAIVICLLLWLVLRRASSLAWPRRVCQSNRWWISRSLVGQARWRLRRLGLELPEPLAAELAAHLARGLV